MGMNINQEVDTQTVQEHINAGKRYKLGKAEVIRGGRDVTVVTWGAMVQETLAAADQLAGEGVAAEVVDVATIKPLDGATICESVGRTGRLVIVNEAPVTGGFGGEVAACVAERALYSLQAPILRVAGYDTVMPLARLEHHYMPSVPRIVRAARETLEAT